MPLPNFYDWKQKEKKTQTLIFVGIRSELKNIYQTHFKKGTWKCLTKPTTEIATHIKAVITWGIYLKIL